ncbi:MAG: galactokinase [Firmicutes bacterium]|nr:galactokinase [Bacillota bacterium]
MECIARLKEAFTRRFGPAALSRTVLAAAPGRVNLIGEHTDYNDGFVLPIAIDRRIWILGAPGEDETVRLYSLDFRAEVTFPLAAVGTVAPDPKERWSNYPRGVLWALYEAGYRLGGFMAVVAGEVPQGAGLSSSAAFEVATAVLVDRLFGLEIPAEKLIRLCQRAENLFVGVNCGIMDQFISRLGRAGHALLLDCRDLSYRYYTLDPAEARVVVVDTGIKHSLVASEYNRRRQECERGVAVLQSRHPSVRALRDADAAMLAALEPSMEPVVAKRCRHVIGENDRTLAAAQALAAGDLELFGRLMYESHASLRDLYEVSCPELDLLVELARGVPGVYGARMTGAGFGGCTVNLVRPEAVEEFTAVVKEKYSARTGKNPAVYLCRAADGGKVFETGEGFSFPD